MRPDSIVRSVRVDFKPERMAEIAHKLTTAITERERIEEERKSAMSNYKSLIDEQEKEIVPLARLYEKGYEMTEVDCHILYDFPELGKKSYVRIDTEEVIETVDMEPDDRQLPLISNSPSAEDLDAVAAEHTAKEATDVPPLPETPEPKPEVTYNSIANIAAVIFNLPSDKRPKAVEEQADKLAPRMLEQGKITDRNGKSHKVKSLEAARGLAMQWLTACLMKEKDDEDRPDGKAAAAGA